MTRTFSSEEIDQLLQQAHRYAGEYVRGIHRRPVFPNEDALAGLGAFEEPLPEQGADATEMLALLHHNGSPATVAQTGGRYFGFVCGGLHPPALAARWLADAWDQNSALHVLSPVASRLEQICEGWLVDLLGLPAGAAAGLVSGTSAATLCGLAAGRNELLRRAGWDVHASGLFGAPGLRVVVGEQAHATVPKVLSLLGLGQDCVEVVPADSQGRMRADRLPALDDRCLVVTQAGNVNSGAFDPLEQICRRARAAGAWVHVDGAFGLWAAASTVLGHLCAGVEGADSWSVDAHKTLNAPYDCGVILCRDRQALSSSLRADGSYIQWSELRDGMHFTPEMSRRARAIELWATLKTLGRRGVEEMIDHLCQLARQCAAGLQDEDFRVLNDVVFNQVLVACDRPEVTADTLRHIQRSGECWCGGAVWKGEPVIRISVCSNATTSSDIERTVAAFVEARGRAT